MRLADAAWKEVDAMTIRNCWRKAGILPSIEAMAPGLSVTPSIPISMLLSTSAEEDGLARVERQLEGALTCGNRCPSAW